MPRRSSSPTDRPLRAIDLFCGAGGLSEGFRAANYEVKYALDIDEDAVATYRQNHPETVAECVSISDRTYEDIRSVAGEVDVVVGGPSCQSFSTAGRKNGWVRKGDPRNDLWKHMLGLVRALRPRAFLLENVPGLVYWKQGEFGAVILEEFQALGYQVSKEILLAADYGVPQRRRRLFIVGVLGDRPFGFPDRTHMGGWRRDYLDRWEARRQAEGLLKHVRVWEAISDLPLLSEGRAETERDRTRLSAFARAMSNGGPIVDHTMLPLSAEHAALIKHVPPGGTWRDIPAHKLPDRFRGMRRTDSTNLLGRLAPDLPAYTITTQFNNVTAGCYTHPFEDRAISIREAARLQTFPDSYEFVGNGVTSKCRQIGNAVPPLLAEVLAAAIAEAVQGEAAATFHPRPTPIVPAASLPAPPPSDTATRQRMRAQKRSATKPEQRILRALRRRGFRPSRDAPIPGLRSKPDLVFQRGRVAVFVHGCFWHGCPEHARPTKSNTKWWADKIAANKKRDAETVGSLTAAGWQVVVAWEHEDPGDAANRIIEVVRQRRARAPRQAA